MTDMALVERPEAPALSMIRPLVNAGQALDAWEAFQELKAKLITADDLHDVGGKKAIKKAGWRKIAAAFGISTEARAEVRDELDHGQFLWRVTVRATAPNGRYAEGTAGCASNERRFAHAQHDVYAMAYTRACNRAISDLVGGGEVSAEELKHEATPRVSPEEAKRQSIDFLNACAVNHLDLTDKARLAFLLETLMLNGGNLRLAYRALKPKDEAPQVIDVEPVEDEDGD